MTAMTRREMLGSMVAGTMMGLPPVLGACAATPAAAPTPLADDQTLDALARRKGLRFGSAVGYRSLMPSMPGSFDQAAYRAVLARECGVLVHENELKWQALRPRPDAFDFGRADALVQWAMQNGLQLRGHTLLWHAPRWLPGWVNQHDFGARPVQEAERLITEHIVTVCQRYRDRIASWDVVNESVTPEDGELRDNVFAPHLGRLGQVELAFRLAHEQMPNAQLVYNDFMTWGGHSARHRAGVLKLLQALKARNVPVHALGLQSHLGTGANGQWVGQWVGQSGGPGQQDEREWRQFLDEVSAMGLELLITELDVNDRYLAADTVKRDAEAAAMVRGYLDVCLSYRNLRTLMAWGLADPVSWMQTWWPRTDGLAKRPSPYDAQLQSKPMRQAIADALRAAPERPPRPAAA